MLWCTSWEALCIRSLFLYCCVKRINFKSNTFNIQIYCVKVGKKKMHDVNGATTLNKKFDGPLSFHSISCFCATCHYNPCSICCEIYVPNKFYVSNKKLHIAWNQICTLVHAEYIMQTRAAGCLYFHEQLHWNLCENKGKHYAEQLVWGVSLIGV